MRKQKNAIKLSVLLLSMLMLFSTISAIEMSLPTSSSTISGSTFFNATVDITADGFSDGAYNCSVYSSGSAGSLTANVTTIFLDTVTNSTGNQTQLNQTISINSSWFEDAIDYGFYTTCSNLTSSVTSSTASSITVNNTVPTAPTSLVPSAGSEDDDGSIAFSGTIDAGKTTSCTLYFPNKNPGSSSYAMTHTGSTCTYTASSVPEETYDYYILASDGTETAPSTTTRFAVGIDTPSNWLFQEGSQVTETDGQRTLSVSDGSGLISKKWLVIFGVIVFVGIVIYRRK